MDIKSTTSVEVNTDQGIFFYGFYGPYFELSNFYSPKKLIIDGKVWPTTEHYYQACKFRAEPTSWQSSLDPSRILGKRCPDHLEYMELIRTVISANKAKCLGNQKAYGYSRLWKHDITKELLPDIIKKYPNAKIISTWDTYKIDVMKKAIEAKFTQNNDLLLILLETGDRPLYEHTGRDYFWGNGGNGLGLNMLGKLLMDLRDKHRSTKIIPTKKLTFYNNKVPFQKSNWVLDNLIVGRYPEHKDPKIHELKSIALVTIGVTDIISLIPKDESKRLRSYRETIKKYNKNIRFYDFPIKDRSIDNDMRTIKFVRVLIKSLLDKNKLFYLHCRGGHGRTGILVSILLGLMFNISSNEALNYCQALHFRRWKSNSIDLTKNIVTEEAKRTCHYRCISPQTKSQYSQVRRILGSLIIEKLPAKV